MRYEVVASRNDASEWRVEAINHPPEGDGECYVTIFSGPHSKERAEEYATLKNAKVAVLVD